MNKNPDREITGKKAGNMVKHMVKAVEQRMAAGEPVSAGPISEDDEKALQEARKENQRSGMQT